MPLVLNQLLFVTKAFLTHFLKLYDKKGYGVYGGEVSLPYNVQHS